MSVMLKELCAYIIFNEHVSSSEMDSFLCLNTGLNHSESYLALRISKTWYFVATWSCSFTYSKPPDLEILSLTPYICKEWYIHNLTDIVYGYA